MKFRDLAEIVQTEVPGCPAFQVERAAREVAITLCTRADIYRADPDTLRVVPGVTSYDLEAPAGAEPNRVLDIQYKGCSLRKVASESEIYALIDKNGPTRPTHYFQRDNDTVIVAPTPRDAEDFRIFLSLKPDAAATSVPDSFAKEYRNLLAIGTKAELMLMNAQPWSNPQLGSLNKQLFDRGVSAAIRRVQFGFSGAPLSVKKRDFI